MEMNLKTPMPSPSDVAYIEDGVHALIMDVLRDKPITYSSPLHDFIYNEVVKEARIRICSSIRPK